MYFWDGKKRWGKSIFTKLKERTNVCYAINYHLFLSLSMKYCDVYTLPFLLRFNHQTKVQWVIKWTLSFIWSNCTEITKSNLSQTCIDSLIPPKKPSQAPVSNSTRMIPDTYPILSLRDIYHTMSLFSNWFLNSSLLKVRISTA